MIQYKDKAITWMYASSSAMRYEEKRSKVEPIKWPSGLRCCLAFDSLRGTNRFIQYRKGAVCPFQDHNYLGSRLMLDYY